MKRDSGETVRDFRRVVGIVWISCQRLPPNWSAGVRPRRRDIDGGPYRQGRNAEDDSGSRYRRFALAAASG
jgi:hypothetical protein